MVVLLWFYSRNAHRGYGPKSVLSFEFYLGSDLGTLGIDPAMGDSHLSVAEMLFKSTLM